MTIKFAERMNRIGTEGAFVVLAKARALEAEGREILHFEIGEPDFPTPDNIIEAAASALQEGYTHYTPAAGILEARQAVAGFLNKRLGTDVDPAEVVLVPGSKNILLFTLLSCVEPGDEVILPDPGYPVYESLVNFIEAVPVSIRLRQENDFRMDMSELAALVTPRTRMLIVNTPQNPTGGILTEDDVRFIADLAREHDLLVVADEIYSQICYGDFKHVSLLAQPGMRERTILMDGMSKAYAMCGWRLGYGVAPRELASKFETLMINSSSCAAAFTQMATIEALTSTESERAVDIMVRKFQRRRDLMVDGLNRIPGFRCNRPEGSFYAFPNIEETGFDERDLADRLLSETGIAVLPGTAFGAAGKGFIRLAYTNSEENISKALDKVEAFIRAN